MTITHTFVVEPDTEYLEKLAVIRRVTDDDREDATTWLIECSDPAACPGWVECGENHDGFDPHDEDSLAYDKYEDVTIHGVPHEWRYGYMWTVDYPGCPVQGFAIDLEPPDELPRPLRPGRWEVDTDWDGDTCILTLTTPLKENDPA